LFPPGTPKVSASWTLDVDNDHDDSQASQEKAQLHEGLKKITISLKLNVPFELSTKLYAKCSAHFYTDKYFHQVIRRRGSKLSTANERGCFWDIDIFDTPRLDYLDSEGSLNVKVTADFFVDSDGIAEILVHEKDATSGRNVIESSKTSEAIVLKQVACLLNDEVTSDVIVVVVDTEKNAEIGKFHCHSAILSGTPSHITDKVKGKEFCVF